MRFGDIFFRDFIEIKREFMEDMRRRNHVQNER